MPKMFFELLHNKEKNAIYWSNMQTKKYARRKHIKIVKAMLLPIKMQKPRIELGDKRNSKTFPEMRCVLWLQMDQSAIHAYQPLIFVCLVSYLR